jgi:indole-3-glycerol phosphate synthase
MSVLSAIVDNTRMRVAERRALVPVPELRARLADLPDTLSLHHALAHGFGVIAEFKRRSPSGGASDPKNLAEALDTYAATPWIVAVSVLTDEDYFGGNLEDLAVARDRVKKPILRKDFIVDEYQVLEARVAGADAILLMASVLAEEPSRMQELFDLARAIGLDVLVELGMTERRIQDLVAVVPAEAQIWGINARQFAKAEADRGDGAFAPGVTHHLPTDLRSHADYRALIPAGKLAVAESGIHTGGELRAARDAGYDAALIGTAFLKPGSSIGNVTRDLATAFRDPV